MLHKRPSLTFRKGLGGFGPGSRRDKSPWKSPFADGGLPGYWFNYWQVKFASMRRFFALPASVLLLATGLV